MSTAGLQQRNQFAAAPDRIEMRLHIAGPCEHLAECERGGEDFHQDWFHDPSRIVAPDARIKLIRNPADHSYVIRLKCRHIKIVGEPAVHE